ncbi:MAG: 50S ribosomal protein L11 methyltransferase, partial [Gaiellaceae bacterium]
MTVPLVRAEQARAVMLELFPEGFEEHEGPDGLELAAYTNAGGEERVWQAFGGAVGDDVAEDWHDRWRRFHRPVRIGELWVGPPWETPDAGALAVVIDPGRAFGTGGHATTRLCLELLQELPRGSLLDIGSGSGVIAVAAAKLGFEPVLALDSDPQAVEATAANALANGVDVGVSLADATVEPLPEATVAVANITLASVGQLGARLRSRLVVTSGYLVSEQPGLTGFRHVD